MVSSPLQSSCVCAASVWPSVQAVTSVHGHLPTYPTYPTRPQPLLTPPPRYMGKPGTALPPLPSSGHVTTHYHLDVSVDLPPPFLRSVSHPAARVTYQKHRLLLSLFNPFMTLSQLGCISKMSFILKAMVAFSSSSKEPPLSQFRAFLDAAAELKCSSCLPCSSSFLTFLQVSSLTS